MHTDDIQSWAPRQTVRFDLIISNPPYYEPGVECATPQREQALHRYAGSPDVIGYCGGLYYRRWLFCVVLPEQIGNAFTQQALNMGWHLRLRTDVAENEARLPHRILLAFSPQAGECFSDRLVIRGSDQHYSESYTALTQAFYLFM